MCSCHLIGRWAGRPLALLALTWATNASAQAVPEGWAQEGFIYCSQQWQQCTAPYSTPVMRYGTTSSFVQWQSNAAQGQPAECYPPQNYNGGGACYLRPSNAADAAAAQELLNQQYIATGKVFALMLGACATVWGVRKLLDVFSHNPSGDRS